MTDYGRNHVIHQGEGGEQGDALMPMLYSLGQHATLQAVQDALLLGEHLFAYLDDIYIVCLSGSPPCTNCWSNRLNILPEFKCIWARHKCGTAVPPGCQALQAAPERVDPDARVRRGGWLPSHEQGIRVLGIPVGHVEFVQAQPVSTTKKHATLCQRVQSVPRDRHNVASLSFDLGGCGLQSAWRARVPAHWASWADCE